jgi:hypothetical protein
MEVIMFQTILIKMIILFAFYSCGQNPAKLTDSIANFTLIPASESNTQAPPVDLEEDSGTGSNLDGNTGGAGLDPSQFGDHISLGDNGEIVAACPFTLLFNNQTGAQLMCPDDIDMIMQAYDEIFNDTLPNGDKLYQDYIDDFTARCVAGLGPGWVATGIYDVNCGGAYHGPMVECEQQ